MSLSQGIVIFVFSETMVWLWYIDRKKHCNFWNVISKIGTIKRICGSIDLISCVLIGSLLSTKHQCTKFPVHPSHMDTGLSFKYITIFIDQSSDGKTICRSFFLLKRVSLRCQYRFVFSKGDIWFEFLPFKYIIFMMVRVVRVLLGASVAWNEACFSYRQCWNLFWIWFFICFLYCSILWVLCCIRPLFLL